MPEVSILATGFTLVAAVGAECSKVAVSRPETNLSLVPAPLGLPAFRSVPTIRNSAATVTTGELALLRHFSRNASARKGALETPLLQTPVLNDFQNPKLELREKEVRKWVANLPVLNLVKAVPALLERLAPLNHERIPPKVRLRLLELYRDPVNTIYHAFDEQTLHHTPLSREERARVKELVGELCAAIATGYKIVIKQNLANAKAPTKDATLLLALQRATEQLAHGLVHAYRTYSGIAPFSFLELHQLYRLAEHLQVLGEQRQSSTPWKSSEKTSILQQYLQVMLLALLDPHHLREGECMVFFELLQELAVHAHVALHPSSHKLSEGEFRIDLTGDSPPRPPHLVTGSEEMEGELRILDIRPLLNDTMRRLEILQSQPSQPDTDLKVQRLRQILNRLGAGRVRQHGRAETRRHVRVAIGLDAIHYFLSHPTAWNLVNKASELHGIQVRDAGTPEDNPSYFLEDWEVASEGIKGLLLVNDRLDLDGLGIGELIGVLNPNEGDGHAPLSVAVIRWVRNQQGQVAELGVETLPGVPQAIQCAHSGAAHSRTMGILLPAVHTIRVASSVIVPQKMGKAGDELILYLDQKILHVILKTRLSELAFADHFALETIATG